MRYLIKRFSYLIACMAASTGASAHAFLDHAMPGVGASIDKAPADLELHFTEGLEPVFSGVALADGNGAPISLGKPTVEGDDRTVLHAHLSRPLKPGLYTVSWHVVSVDTHHTAGTYHFTVTP